MNFIIVSNYYYPELGAAPNRIRNLAEGLVERSNEVEVICPLPNYPKGKIFAGYPKRLQITENINAVKIFRSWIYPSVSKNPIVRICSMFSFAASLWTYSFSRRKIKNADWIIIQNSPLLVSFSAIVLFKKLFKKNIALNVSDLWPLSALELGAIQNGRFYRLLEWIEEFNYKNSDRIIGQSNEILEHVTQITPNKQVFLYRNIQRSLPKRAEVDINAQNSFKIVYAGLLGVAQGIYTIVEQINFKELNVEFDIYGQGYEHDKIIEYLKHNPDRGIKYKGSLSKKDLDSVLPQYQASIVPLVNSIKGAVPSKIFELMQLNIPVIFCGGGEGAKIIEKYNVGITTPPGDFIALKEAIYKIKNMPENEFKAIQLNCRKATTKHFNFEKQLDMLIKNLN